MLVEPMEEVVEGLHAHKYQQRADTGKDIHASATSQANGSSHPKASSCGQATDYILVLTEDDSTRTNETDTADHLSSYTGDIPALKVIIAHGFLETIGRHYHKQSRTHCHKEMGAETSFLGTVLSFQSDKATQ